jgi:hypothetical protein
MYNTQKKNVHEGRRQKKLHLALPAAGENFEGF